jgi:opacity protein-like surface antigen
MKLLKICAVSVLAATVVGCASETLQPQAAHVIVSPNAAPKGCKYAGQVVGNQGNAFTGAWTSNRNLEEGSMNNMKNQAANLGANYVQLVNSRAGSTGSMSSYGGDFSGSMQETNVTNLGNAYVCKPSSIGL